MHGLFDILKWPIVVRVDLYARPPRYDELHERRLAIVGPPADERVELTLDDGEVVRVSHEGANFIFIPPNTKRPTYACYYNSTQQKVGHHISWSCVWKYHDLTRSDYFVW